MGNRTSMVHSAAAIVLAVFWFWSCGDENDEATTTGDGGAAGTGGSTGSGELDIALCDPAGKTFSLAINNPYFPLQVGTVWTYKGDEEGTTIDLQITVLDETEDVAGVTTRVVEENEEEDGEVVEISRNYFAQATDGTVCYFGEDVDIYEDGAVVSHEGAWRAGHNGNKPGIMMPAHPALGMSYHQEYAPGVALDHAEIVSIGQSTTVPAGTYDDTLSTNETSELDPGELSSKTYARGVGLVVDESVELLSVVTD